MGHVRDLPQGKMGVEVGSKGFIPAYTVLPDKKKIVAELAKASKEADTIYLATDPDREGEAISWHLIKAGENRRGQDTARRLSRDYPGRHPGGLRQPSRA